MKVNSISSLNYNKSNYNTPSFKRTAVPYPEYKSAYETKKHESPISIIVDRIHDLFSPKVTNESRIIKAEIDKLVDTKAPKAHLITVFA